MRCSYPGIDTPRTRDDIRLPDYFNPPPDTSIRPIDEVRVEVEPVYRLLNTDLNLQFYTTSELEKDTVRDLPQYELEGVSFIAPAEPPDNTVEDELTGITAASNIDPVYRLYNSNTGVHLYTISEVEKDSVVENLPNYTLEGIEYYGYTTQIEGTVPLYRFYNQSLDAHFYTPSVAERDEYIDSPDFRLEGNDGGIAFYVLPASEI
ncbi:hypothetical protein I4641_12995 [Waterburya agarophytonicola K14]|uniref:DUF5648 domain-containing protein n=1 Tax=Waterburya agarophytonicola KI4 TaxID=2874699 RepID=A0A964FFK4_9CYAN|nr:hypothetical protein [Waterburya agarophytonicola]MCC0177895.1 hypothetical protein [Waterburya agarophytonicola KI4]